MRKAKLYFVNGLLVAAVGLLLRFAGMAYNVYISGKLGAEGMGLLSLVSSVYALALTLAVSGVNLTCTRLVAEALSSGSPAEARRSLKGCALYALFFGLCSAALLFFLAPFIGEKILVQPRAVLCLRALCPALAAASLSSCFSGYLTAARKAGRTAFSSIPGEGLKLLFTIVLFSFLLSRGMGAEAVMIASCLSELCSFFILCLILFFELRKNLPKTGRTLDALPRRLFGVALPLAFAAWVRSALVTAEHVLIPKGLRRSGSENALADYGVMHGMALPVVFFPYAILAPFTSLLMPEISRFKARKEEKDIAFVSSLTLRMTLIFASGCSALLAAFGRELGLLLYGNPDAGRTIALFAFLIPVMYTDTATDSLLKGLGEQVYCMKVNIADAALSLLLVLVAVPRLGALGYLLTVFVSECVNTFFSVLKLAKKTRLFVPLFSSIALPLLCAFLAALASRRLLLLLHPGARAFLLLALFLFPALYLPLLVLTRAFRREDRRYLLRLFKKS